MQHATALLGAGLLAAGVFAQPATDSPLDPQPNGPRKRDPAWHFLVGPTVHVDPDQLVESAIVEIRDGRIVSVTDMAAVRWALPAGAQAHDLAGMHVYAGFIDAHLAIEVPRPDRDAPGAHWNAGVTPQRSALDVTGVPADDAKRLRGLGFAAAAIAPEGGIFAGRSAVVSLAEPPVDPSDGRAPVYRPDAYHALSFSGRGGPENRGEFSGYPNSQMGAIALIRQTLIDSDWRDRLSLMSSEEARDAYLAPSCLAHLSRQQHEDAPLLFRTASELEGLRAGKIAAEFGRRFIVLGSGTEFRRLDAIAANHAEEGAPVYVLPLTLPETPDVETVGAADSVDLRDLLTWEQAPTNARRLDGAGVRVCLTAGGLRRGEKFEDNLRRAIEVGGLEPERALAMVTTAPAEVLGVSEQLGTVEPGKIANLVVATGDMFAPGEGSGDERPRRGSGGGDRARVLDVWIDGERYAISEPDPPFDGSWTFRVGEFFSMKLEIEGEEITATEGEGEDANTGPARKVKIDADARTISFVLDDTDDGTGTYVQSGVLGPDGVVRGTGLDPSGGAFQWTMTRAPEPDLDPEVEPGAPARAAEPDAQAREGDEPADADESTGDTNKRPPEELPGYPFGAYAIGELPAQESVLFTNATVWTSGPAGVIENGWVFIKDGKISAVGEDGPPGTAGEVRVIDLAGKHITPGLIDAHSHTGISRGVNEGGQSVTAEVRIGDVTDPDSMNWYRQLAGGVTAVNSMHGSANPIGGQTQTNKVRWGAVHPDDMHMEGAKPGIKFALGENVKQSNWESDRTRYPQTRMGVETLIRDRFAAAREYGAGLRQLESAEREIADSIRREIDRDEVRADLGEVTISVHATAGRRDLELETLAEILAGERLVHCHSYRQDEILMLCRVAQDFGFTIGTFQHGLEVYKVAEAVREAAIGASLFSDWWAYKVEVQDAIAQAGPLQAEVGVLTSYNSDSDELARRMNVEAAKAVKYSGGRLSEEEALKFVTINPAIQLGVGERIGSIEEGKDADLAIWSGPPLSSFSRCEAAWIDGREYFSLERDRILRDLNAEHRRRIVQKILAEGGGKGKKRGGDEEEESPGEEGEPPRSLRERIAAAARERHYLDLYLRGINPADHRCGDCGMSDMEFGGAR